MWARLANSTGGREDCGVGCLRTKRAVNAAATWDLDAKAKQAAEEINKRKEDSREVDADREEKRKLHPYPRLQSLIFVLSFTALATL